MATIQRYPDGYVPPPKPIEQIERERKEHDEKMARIKVHINDFLSDLRLLLEQYSIDVHHDYFTCEDVEIIIHPTMFNSLDEK